MTVITYLDLLTEQECLEVRSVVYELKKLWQPRNINSTFFTLGSTAYQDAFGYGASIYYGKAKLFNPILFKHFEWLYKRLSELLAKELGEPACYQQKFALPGFHIFLTPESDLSKHYLKYSLEEERCLAHSDEQYKLLDWESFGGCNSCKTISFTLAITLPHFGGGLDVWDFNSKDRSGLSEPEFRQILCSREKTFYPYQLGKVAIHSGLFFHQIAPIQKIHVGDERITLQGHGLFCQGTWHLYW
jgi:hypothetical protein